MKNKLRTLAMLAAFALTSSSAFALPMSDFCYVGAGPYGESTWCILSEVGAQMIENANPGTNYNAGNYCIGANSVSEGRQCNGIETMYCYWSTFGAPF